MTPTKVQAAFGRSRVKLIAFDDEPEEIIEAFVETVGSCVQVDIGESRYLEFIGQRIEPSVRSISKRFDTTIFLITFVGESALGYDYEPKKDVSAILAGETLQLEKYDGKSGEIARRIKKMHKVAEGISKVAKELHERSRGRRVITFPKPRFKQSKVPPTRTLFDLLGESDDLTE